MNRMQRYEQVRGTENVCSVTNIAYSHSVAILEESIVDFSLKQQNEIIFAATMHAMLDVKFCINSKQSIFKKSEIKADLLKLRTSEGFKNDCV